MLGGFDGMGLQAILANALGIGVIRLNRHDSRSPKFGRLFDNKVGAGFLDRREQQPQIWWIALLSGLFQGGRASAALGRVIDTSPPFTVAAVEHGYFIPLPQAHHPGKVMRLTGIQRHGLSLCQRVIYVQPDFSHHGTDAMQSRSEKPDTVFDAPKDNWVDTYAPAGWRPLLRLSRADRPIGTWLLLLPCWWGIGLSMMAYGPRRFDLWIALACAIGAVVMRGAGCTWNDITDRDFDAAVARTRSRPLPSGQVTLKGAYLWMIAQALIGFVVLLSLGQAAIWMGFASLGFVAIYPFAKRFTWWPQLFLGFAFNWGVMLAYAAHAGRLDLAPVIAWLGGIAWTIFYDTIYAHQDTEDDALIGVKSTARLWGNDSPRWLFRFGALATVLLAIAVWMAGTGGIDRLIGLFGVGAFATHMVWQWLRLDGNDPTRCLILFRSNRNAGVILALFLGVAGIV